MKRADIVAYATRDWRAVQEAKERYWAERKPSLTPEEALEIADGLRRHVKSLRPDWPSAEERQHGLELHARVSAALRSVFAKPHPDLTNEHIPREAVDGLR
jgi:hypothetical protein